MEVTGQEVEQALFVGGTRLLVHKVDHGVYLLFHLGQEIESLPEVKYVEEIDMGHGFALCVHSLNVEVYMGCPTPNYYVCALKKRAAHCLFGRNKVFFVMVLPIHIIKKWIYFVVISTFAPGIPSVI